MKLNLVKNYKTYDRYKDSGVEWLGEVPEDWKVFKLKQFANVITGSTPSRSEEKNYSNDGLPWIKPDNLKGFNPINETKEKISLSGLKSIRTIPPKSILVNGIGNIGQIGVVYKSAATNQQINSIVIRNKARFSFLKYAVFASRQDIEANSNKVVVSILNKTQQKIADYLDKKTETIDKIIKRKKS